ncbi:MAG: hypothetical protein U0X87_02245 [Anaerolineales bacterium]
MESTQSRTERAPANAAHHHTHSATLAYERTAKIVFLSFETRFTFILQITASVPSEPASNGARFKLETGGYILHRGGADAVTAINNSTDTPPHSATSADNYALSPPHTSLRSPTPPQPPLDCPLLTDN